MERSILDNFLKNQIGLNDGLETQLELTGQFQNNINMRVSQERDFKWAKTKISILDWLRDGSSLEDVPNPRARHHFHDPIRDTGLDNSNADPVLLSVLWIGSKWFYPDYWGFDATGLSTLDRAKGLDGAWGDEYLNYYNWIYARELFYAGLTEQSKYNREEYLGSTFVTLGHICHLLEDMGVPAHTRNDFVWGHLVADFYKDLTGAQNPWFKGGHPFEAWMETQIKINDEQIPSAYLTRLMDSPPALAAFEHYWDTGICEESGTPQWQGDSTGWPAYGFGNPPPEKSWGLSECTNYQFLSYSTIYYYPGMKQSFPHPAKEHTRVDWYPTGPDGSKQYYRIGYEVPHLARATYTAYIFGIPVGWETDTTEDEKVYEDYAKRTIPRTIDYTTGLINYFFRGRLSAEPNCANPDCSQIELVITNDSDNSGVPQTLKGGTFELYWDDQSGSRGQVAGFTVPGWTSGSTLSYGESVTGQFEPASQDVKQYVLVYKGQINQNPADPDPDPDDPDAIAVDIFSPPPHITAITPDMGHPGSVLLIEGAGFSATPAENVVRFEDVNGVYPDVYGNVLSADVNGTWLMAELPFFDADDVDYFWTYTTVTVDEKTSAAYDFRLTNYIWCTIALWDGGEDIDDEFDLYINGEYLITSYQDPPSDPTVVEIGFWYEDEYGFVDTYLYESYGTAGGTLGISIVPYVERVVANRWNSSSETVEFIYDNLYSGPYGDYFGSSLLEIPDDGIELDVYLSLTYTGMEQSQSTTQTMGIVEESTADDSTSSIREARGKPGFVDAVQRTYEPAKVHKRSRKRMGSNSRTRR